MAELSRGSQITACGVVRGEPRYTYLSSGKPALTYWLYCENPSGKSVQLWVVSYGDAARTESRVLHKGSQVVLMGTLQTRVVGDKEQTEVVSQQVTYWPTLAPRSGGLSQRFGAQAVLLGEIIERPVFTLLGELRTPFVRFGLRCANPKGNDAKLTVVHFGHMAATYGRTLDQGMRIVLMAEARSHNFYPPVAAGNQASTPRSAQYVLQFVTEIVQVLDCAPTGTVAHGDCHSQAETTPENAAQPLPATPDSVDLKANVR